MFATAPTGLNSKCIVQSAMGNLIPRFGHGVVVMFTYYLETLMNKDQVKGRVEEGKGKIKETVGKVIDNEQMEVEGKVQKNVGKGQAGYGDVKEDVKENIKKKH